MVHEIYPSSYLCDCGRQIDFFENTIREMKDDSLKKRNCIGEGGADPHLVYFFKGAFDGIYCPVHKKKYNLPRPDASEKQKVTPMQGQYLAFIYYYMRLNGCAPAERDMEKYFGVTPPSVHQMVLTLEKKNLIARIPGVARSIKLLLSHANIPALEARGNSEACPVSTMPSPERMAGKRTGNLVQVEFGSGKQPVSGKAFQLKVVLKGSKPPIWRRLLVGGDVTLQTLHDILQIAMGWDDSHMHVFDIKGRHYGVKDPELDTSDERRVKLQQIAAQPKTKFRYEYDMGDGWLHEITVEKVLPVEPGQQYPACIAGARACPPEDCGGVWGYEELLAVLADPKHPDHAERRDWLGDDFDAEAFDLDAINERLKGLA